MRGVGEGFVQRCWFSGRVFSSCSECLLLKVSVSFSEQILNSQMDCQISIQTLKTTKRMLTTKQPPPKRHLPKRHPLNSHSPSPYPPETCPSVCPSTHHTPSNPSREPRPPFSACDESRFPPPPCRPFQGYAESPSPPSQDLPPHPCGTGTAYGYTSHMPPSPTDLSPHWQRCSREAVGSAPRCPSSTTPHSASIRLPSLASQQAHSTAS